MLRDDAGGTLMASESSGNNETSLLLPLRISLVIRLHKPRPVHGPGMEVVVFSHPRREHKQCFTMGGALHM